MECKTYAEKTDAYALVRKIYAEETVAYAKDVDAYPEVKQSYRSRAMRLPPVILP